MSEVTTTEKTTENLPTAPSPYGELAGLGSSNISPDELLIPFLNLLQAGTPIVLDPTNTEAVAGLMFNSVLNEFYKEIFFVPCHRAHSFIEYVPRNEGGGGGQGFVANHEVSSDIVVNAIQRGLYVVKDGKTTRVLLLESGNHLVETYTFSGLLIDSPEATSSNIPCVINFQSSKITPYKKTMSAIRTVKFAPPLFVHVLHFKVVFTEKGGFKYFNYDIKLLKDKQLPAPTTETGIHPLMVEGLALHNAVESGQARADHSTVTDDTVTTDDSENF